jgi:hypothetical protein
MRKILLALVVMIGLSVVAKAEDTTALFQWGGLKGYIPLKNISIVSLYDLWNSGGLYGAETTVLSFEKINLNIGAMGTTPQYAKGGDGSPYASLDYDFASIKPDFLDFINDADLHFGVFAGYDFNLKKIDENGNEETGDFRVGVKMSKRCW